MYMSNVTLARRPPLLNASHYVTYTYTHVHESCHARSSVIALEHAMSCHTYTRLVRERHTPTYAYTHTHTHTHARESGMLANTDKTTPKHTIGKKQWEGGREGGRNRERHMHTHTHTRETCLLISDPSALRDLV